MSTARALLSNPAPWAEVVPEVGPITVDLLLELPDDCYMYEVVNGTLVRMAGSGEDATRLALRVGARLLTYAEDQRLGVVTGADGVYKFSGAETGLLPDVGFYALERHPRHHDTSRPIPFAPDLAVEVASPSQDADAMAAKARAYFAGGTQLVWVIWPQARHIDVWSPDRLDGPAATLNIGDSLDGEDVVPGFSYPVARVFADPLA